MSQCDTYHRPDQTAPSGKVTERCSPLAGRRSPDRAVEHGAVTHQLLGHHRRGVSAAAWSQHLATEDRQHQWDWVPPTAHRRASRVSQRPHPRRRPIVPAPPRHALCSSTSIRSTRSGSTEPLMPHHDCESPMSTQTKRHGNIGVLSPGTGCSDDRYGAGIVPPGIGLERLSSGRCTSPSDMYLAEIGTNLISTCPLRSVAMNSTTPVAC